MFLIKNGFSMASSYYSWIVVSTPSPLFFLIPLNFICTINIPTLTEILCYDLINFGIILLRDDEIGVFVKSNLTVIERL